MLRRFVFFVYVLMFIHLWRRDTATCIMLLYTNFDQTFVNSLHGLLNCKIGGLDCHAIITEFRTRVHCIHM